MLKEIYIGPEQIITERFVRITLKFDT
jgi:hypothetical protein